jgi:hypothetical protein
MSKIVLGAIAGTILGLLDGCSAFLIPEAAGMMAQIIIGSTVKGLINGLIAGMIAKKVNSVLKSITFGAVVGIILSALAAIPSGAYMEIITPGAIVGLLCGWITYKWGK